MQRSQRRCSIGTAQYRHNYRFYEEQQSRRSDARKNKSFFLLERKQNEIQRQQQAQRGERCAAGSGCIDASLREVSDGLLREEQNQQS